MSQRKKTSKVTTGHKITLGTLSVLGLVAGWNVVGRAEREPESEEVAGTKATVSPTDMAAPVAPPATPWPTIPPLAERSRLDAGPLPTLAVVFTADADPGATGSGGLTVSVGVPSLMPLPTLAPLPTMPEYVAPPPPQPASPPQVAAAPPPPPSNGGGDTSGGS